MNKKKTNDDALRVALRELVKRTHDVNDCRFDEDSWQSTELSTAIENAMLALGDLVRCDVCGDTKQPDADCVSCKLRSDRKPLAMIVQQQTLRGTCTNGLTSVSK